MLNSIIIINKRGNIHIEDELHVRVEYKYLPKAIEIFFMAFYSAVYTIIVLLSLL